MHGRFNRFGNPKRAAYELRGAQVLEKLLVIVHHVGFEIRVGNVRFFRGLCWFHPRGRGKNSVFFIHGVWLLSEIFSRGFIITEGRGGDNGACCGKSQKYCRESVIEKMKTNPYLERALMTVYLFADGGFIRPPSVV